MADAGAEQLLIVVPTRNEGARIRALLVALQSARLAGAELVLVDAQSCDDTCEQARALVDCILTSAPGRGRQLALAIANSSRPLIWMLHADSGVGERHFAAVLRAFDAGAAWGRFDIAIERDAASPETRSTLAAPGARGASAGSLRLIATMMNLRTRLTGIVTGDHGIFCQRAALERAGGFPEQPLMEDIEVSRRLRRIDWPVALRLPLATSSRRWEQRGVLRTIWQMWSLRLRYFLGAAPAALAREYYGD